MIDEVETNLYKLEIPLPENPLRSVNCYLLKGPQRFLLIDTSMNRKECLEGIQRDLTRLSVDLNNTDLFITHLHADHIGLVSKLATEGSRIYFNRIEAERVKRQDFWKQAYAAWLSNGFPEDELSMLLEEHPSRRYGPRKDIAFCLCSDRDNITIGDYSLTCIETPGHSPGHLCLFDPEKKILFSGDHLLGDITPNISAAGFLDNENPLRDYFTSLDRICALDVDMVLPGHRSPFKNHRKRASELKRHHEMRLDEVVSILHDRASITAYEIASRMTWEMNCEWSDFPVTQKWFAASEALAHLIYLEDDGVVEKEMIGGLRRYSLPLQKQDKSNADQGRS